MFEKNFSDSYQSHSTSDNDRLSRAYPNSPIHSGEGKHITEFSREGVTKWYVDNVLTGDFPEDSDFKTSDYDYGAVPDAIPQQPDEENSVPGKPGSTIVASGLGPNVATIDLTNLDDVPMVDPSSASSAPPFAGVGAGNTPKATSTKIGEQNFTDLQEDSSGAT